MVFSVLSKKVSLNPSLAGTTSPTGLTTTLLRIANLVLILLLLEQPLRPTAMWPFLLLSIVLILLLLEQPLRPCSGHH